ncbi:MAG: integrase [Nostoc sp.]|uniref:integrase n=1 Tax=Nostoc sp. TaxID=1180 RepID=UPI002FFA0355
MKWTLEAVNDRLKAGKIGVAVCVRGDRLSLRATFPPKPGSSKVIWHQQYLALGIYANPAGLQRAEAEAKITGGLLARGEFDWSRYLPEQEQKAQGCEYWIGKFEEDYYGRRGKNPTTENTWKSDYLSAWKLLSGELNPENLIAAACSVPANTRKRKLVCEKFTALAKFAGLVVDLSPYTGTYGASESLPRYIPSTSEIEEVRSLFDDRPDWQWAYGVLSTYGLRPHEIFFCEISPEPPHILKVLKGKTGSREVYPYHKRWAVDWELYKTYELPVQGKTFKDYGNRVGKTFSRRKVSFTPYCLRHAFCIRLSTEYKIPVAVAADWTGHDSAVFLRIYNRWISESEKRRVFDESQNASVPRVQL